MNTKLEAKFIKDKEVIFSPLSEFSLPFLNAKSMTERFTLEPSKSYRTMVKNKAFEDVDRVLVNARLGFKILIKDKTDQDDVFIAKVIKMVRIGKEDKEYPSPDEIKIKISRQSPGYEPIKEAPANTTTIKTKR